ncbi:MAG: hypothetical protein AAF514_19655 [Verrucomicrobiota bacterium]
MNKERFFWLIALVATGVGGYVVGSLIRSEKAGAESSLTSKQNSYSLLDGPSSADTREDSDQREALENEIDRLTPNLGTTSRYYRLRDTIERLAAIDPVAAMAKADALPNKLKRLYQHHTIFAIWAGNDPDAAPAYIEEPPLTAGFPMTAV